MARSSSPKTTVIGGRRPVSGTGGGLTPAVMRGNVSSPGQQRGVFLAEHLGTETHCGSDLRLTECALAWSRDAQRIEQRTRAGVEQLLQLVVRALRDLIDGKLAGVIATHGYEAYQSLGFRHFVSIQFGN